MRIEDKRSKMGKDKFGSIYDGESFEYDGIIFIKLFESYEVYEGKRPLYNACRLDIGKLWHFDYFDLVNRINTKVTIEDDKEEKK